MLAVLFLLLVHFFTTENLNIESYLYPWCDEPMKIIDFQKLRDEDFMIEAQNKCGLSLKHIPNKNSSSDWIDQLSESSISNLKVLKVSDGMGNIDSKLFRLDLKLYVLDLSRNNLQYLDIPEDHLSYTSNLSNIFDYLETIDLSQNNFTNISFIKCKGASLFDLDLSQNQLKEVPLTSLLHFPNLNKLIIRRNNIVAFEQGSSEILTLEYLDVSFNNLSNLNGLENFMNLKVLFLDHNVFPIVNEALFTTEMWSLAELSLNNVGAEEVTSNAFRHTPNLKNLTLSQNKIGYLNPKIFSTLKRLEYIDISHNFLTDLDGRSSRKKLFYFNFSNNRIKKFDYNSIISSSPSLNEINLLGNQFSCDYFDDMLSFFEKTSINVISEERCSFSETSNDSFCCATGNLLTTSTVIYENVKFNSKEINSETLSSLEYMLNRTSQNISDFISSMEKKSDAFFKLLFYQFGFIVTLWFVYIIICIFRYCGKKNHITNKRAEVEEVKII